MTQITNPLELYKLLEKTNCKQCLLPSCMAFAVAVVQGRKKLAACPHLDNKIVEQLDGKVKKHKSLAYDQDKVLVQLKQEIVTVDFGSAPARLSANFEDDRLAINCLGKDFMIDQAGEMVSDCHVNPWVLIPMLRYILHCRGKELSGQWLPFGELQGAGDWSRFFSHRCEGPLLELIDAHTELVFEILHLFGAQPLPGKPLADQSLIIYPLPRVPFLINYWQPEDGFGSKLNLLFDRSAAANSDPESIYLLSRGLVEMFRQLIVRHSRDGKLF
jgi:hypothetical protein